ncbi:MAG: DUF58 domain-containing protein [Oceanobacter sp.]
MTSQTIRNFKQRRKEYWSDWLERRFPGQSRVSLGYRSIFILPSATGFLFLLLIVVMLVTAINYKNSLIYASTFWLVSIGLVTMYFTFSNLHGLSLTTRRPSACFAGDVVEIPIRLIAPSHSVWGIRLAFQEQPMRQISVPRREEREFLFSYQTWTRGPLELERLKLESGFPLGLYRAWSWARLEIDGLVYPKPEFMPFVFEGGDLEGELEGATLDQLGNEDLRGIRDYQPGDSLRQIAWKQVAQGRGMKTKEFDSDKGISCWLSWDAASGDMESRLSILCGWVLTAHDEGWDYGLQLPGIRIKPDSTDTHRDACLRSLALYGLDAGSKGGVA